MLAAIEAGKTIALANKEMLVMAGALVMEAARRRGVAVLPVDSEHNAIHQCLHGRDRRGRPPADPDRVRRAVPRPAGATRSRDVTPDDALRHPTWKMGPKITIDSATLMNKGLEVIEAHWLFDVPADRIDVVVHPQSIVHSMVEFVDGSSSRSSASPTCGCRSSTRSRIPERWDGAAAAARPDAVRAGSSSSRRTRRGFPASRLAFRALAGDAGLPVVLNAANEVAVAAFLDGRLRFHGDSRRHRRGDGRLRAERRRPRFAIWMTCASIDALGARVRRPGGRQGYNRRFNCRSS